MLTRHILLQLLCSCLIVRRSSQAPPDVPPPGVPVTPRCRVNSDTVYLLDSSGSIGEDNFKKMLQIIDNMSWTLRPIGPSANQVGVEVFSNNAATAIRLKDHSSYSTLKQAIFDIQYKNGATYTNKGLRRMCRIAFSGPYGDRRSAPNIGIVLTDGKSTNPSATIQAAKECRRKGVRLLAIPIGNSVNMEEIFAITNAKSSILPASNFDDLLKPTFLQNLVGMRCGALGRPAPPP